MILARNGLESRVVDLVDASAEEENHGHGQREPLHVVHRRPERRLATSFRSISRSPFPSGRALRHPPPGHAIGLSVRRRTNEGWLLGAPILAILLGAATLAGGAAPSFAVPSKSVPGKKKAGDGHPPKKIEKTKAPTHRPTAPSSPEPVGPLPAAPATTPAERTTLPNGLSLVLAPAGDRESVTVALVVRSGAALDPQGKGGSSAVAAEVMTLRESPLARAVEERGGRLEVDVARDRVSYVITAPPHELELAIASEAARIDPVTKTTSEALEVARASLVEQEGERAITDRLESMVFQGFAPYEVATLGSPAERAALSPADVDAFVADTFVPARATVVVTGRFDRARAIELSKKWLEPLASRTSRASSSDSLQEQTNQRTADLSLKGAPTTLLYGWALPRNASKADLPKLEALAALLAGGPSSRLARALSESGGTVDARIEDREGPGLFVLRVEGGADPAPTRRAVETALAALGKEPASAREIDWVKRAAWASHLARLEDPVRAAIDLAARDLEGEAKRDALSRIDAGGLREAASKYLGPLRRTVITVRDGEATAKPRASSPAGEATAKRGGVPKSEPARTEPPKAEPAKAPKTKPAGKGQPAPNAPRPAPSVDPKSPRHPAKKKGP